MTYQTILEVIHNWAREYDVIPYNKNLTERSFEGLAEALEFTQHLEEYLDKRGEMLDGECWEDGGLTK